MLFRSYHEAKIYIDQAINNLDSTQNNNTVIEHAGDIYAMNGLTEQALTYWKQSYDAGNKSDMLELKLREKRYISEESLKKKTLPAGNKAKAVLRNKKKNGKKK